MLATKVGLVDMTGEVSESDMAAAAAALNIQVTRDLPQYWTVSATVYHLPNPHDIPQGFWPVMLVKTLPPGEGGFHMTRHNQPYAKVIVTPNSDEWTVDASHEIVEMLVDPFGNRLQTSQSIEIVGGVIKDGPARFEYLVEACDPCEADAHAYSIDGVMVSDFITPHFYDPGPSPGTRYSFTGAIKAPRQILPGGYISWTDPVSGEMQQILWVNPGEPPQLRTLGPASGASLRQFVEQKTHALVRDKRPKPGAEVTARRQTYRGHLAEAGRVRAREYV